MTAPQPGIFTKAAQRADAMARRNAMPAEARKSAGAVIVRKALDLIVAGKPQVIAAYRAIRTEVIPDPILDWAFGNGVEVLLPSVVDATTMIFRRYREGDPLLGGGLGTMAPGPDAAVMEPHIIVVPMVGFDRAGIRLGHGAGYYDRAVAAQRARGPAPGLIGLAFAAQEISAIPAASHDIRMDWIVTEHETIDCRGTG